MFTTRTLIPLLLTFSAFSPPLLAQAPKPAPKDDEVENCLGCHGDKDASFKLPSGEVVPLYVARETFDKSVHGPLGSCTGCHAGQAEVPHPAVETKNRDEFAATFREACKSCHFENYTKAIDSVHYRVLSKGGSNAPFCADCHGSHDIAKPNAPRTKVSATCGSCHAIIAGIYAKSVHGKALAAGNTDVPVCTDCHHAHDIADPRTTDWRLTTVALCGSCHSNKTMMAKYGLSTNVLKTYLSDFHGMSASLSKGQKNEPKAVTALCIDCHGTHDIVKVKDSGSHVFQANLQKTCAKCHTGANANLPGAWLSHYEPSLKHAPLVWLVNLGYMIFIPFVIGGLVLQILLSLWRVMVNR